ncbi:unnamed protein product, partial [Ectocarpus sp. 12 AP-2014]
PKQGQNQTTKCRYVNSITFLGCCVVSTAPPPCVVLFGGRVDYVVRGREPPLGAKGMIAPRCAKLVKHPQGSYTVNLTVSGKSKHQKISSTIRSCHPYAWK